MPGSHRKQKGKRLTQMGLITVTVATLLMMAWAIFPTAALANQNITVNQSSLSSHACDSTEWHFIITQIDVEAHAPASIHVTWANGASANVSLSAFTGHTAHYTTTANLNSTVTNATASIYDSWDGTFVLSHGPCGVPTTTPTTTTTTPTTTTTTPTTTTTTPTTTTTTPTTTTTTPTTTTTESPTIGPTTVRPTTSESVGPTTVTPGGTAFTGIENVVPLGTIALILMTAGSGMLWAGSRRRKDDDED
jgi:hypothetical protein